VKRISGVQLQGGIFPVNQLPVEILPVKQYHGYPCPLPDQAGQIFFLSVRHRSFQVTLHARF